MNITPTVAADVIAVVTALFDHDYETATLLMREHQDPEDLARGAFSMAASAITVIAEEIGVDRQDLLRQLGLAAAQSQEDT